MPLLYGGILYLYCSFLLCDNVLPSRLIPVDYHGLKVAAFLRCYLTPILFGLTDGNAGALLIKKTRSELWSTQPVQTGGCGADVYLRELSVFLRGECVGTDRLDWTEMDVQVGASE